MAAERNQHQISSVLTRIASGFSTFILAVILSTHYHSLGPNISPRDLNSQSFPIVVAKTEIPVGTRIIAEHLTIAQFPRNVAVEGAFHTIDDNLLGRVAAARITPREPITESRLVPVGSAAGFSSVIPQGYRPTTVRVDEVVGASRFIMRGARVDIVVVIERGGDNGRERVAKIVLENIKVVGTGPKNEKEAARVKAVTLQVTAEQAKHLARVSNEGKLRLVMRNSVD